jgi:hypothetical protein
MSKHTAQELIRALSSFRFGTLFKFDIFEKFFCGVLLLFADAFKKKDATLHYCTSPRDVYLSSQNNVVLPSTKRGRRIHLHAKNTAREQ